MSQDETYSVELTFREWITICECLGYRESHYKLDGLEGQANRCDALLDKIAEGLGDK